MVKWILSQTASATAPSEGETKTYPYKLKDGTTVSLDFPLFLEGQGPKVTKEVFHGYQLYNSYCYRCHGTDASGSQLAPDLRHSLVGWNEAAAIFYQSRWRGKRKKECPPGPASLARMMLFTFSGT
jgi:mono/diheme cytochrome c family protein